MTVQMALVGEAGAGGGLGHRHAAVDRCARLAHAPLDEPCVRRQAILAQNARSS